MQCFELRPVSNFRIVVTRSLTGLPVHPRQGFTLVEVLVAFAIVGLLIALILPAVQSARATARRIECSSKLRQVGIAMHSYHDLHQMYPPGNSNGFSMFVAVLPQIDQASLFNRVVFTGPENAENSYLRKFRLKLLICPSDPGVSAGIPIQPTNFVGNSGTGLHTLGMFTGVFQPLVHLTGIGGGPVRSRDVTDGHSNTVAFSEVLIGNGTRHPLRNTWDVPREFANPLAADQFLAACDQVLLSSQPGNAWDRGMGWCRGNHGFTMYNHMQTPNHRACTNNSAVLQGTYPAVSQHAGGANVCLADGAVRFVSESTDRSIWRALGTRSEADPVPEF